MPSGRTSRQLSCHGLRSAAQPAEHHECDDIARQRRTIAGTGTDDTLVPSGPAARSPLPSHNPRDPLHSAPSRGDPKKLTPCPLPRERAARGVTEPSKTAPTQRETQFSPQLPLFLDRDGPLEQPHQPSAPLRCIHAIYNRCTSAATASSYANRAVDCIAPSVGGADVQPASVMIAMSGIPRITGTVSRPGRKRLGRLADPSGDGTPVRRATCSAIVDSLNTNGPVSTKPGRLQCSVWTRAGLSLNEGHRRTQGSDAFAKAECSQHCPRWFSLTGTIAVARTTDRTRCVAASGLPSDPLSGFEDHSRVLAST